MTAPVTNEIHLDDPVFSAACVALIIVSITWVVVVRLIARNLRRAAEVLSDDPPQIRDVWRLPPSGSRPTT